MQYFNYEAPAREAGLSDADIQVIVEAIRKEFPGDEMMRELHVLRACVAIRDGHAKLGDVVERRAA